MEVLFQLGLQILNVFYNIVVGPLSGAKVFCEWQ